MKKDNSLTLNWIAEYANQNRIPYQATIELLSSCNFQCVHCYLPNHNCMGLSFEKVIDIFRQLRELGTMSLTLTGGEIFVRQDILDIIKTARKMGFSVQLLSNASLLTENMADELAKLYISVFSTTVFSLDEDVNDRITGVPGSLKAVLHGLDILEKYGINTEVKTPLMKINRFAYRRLQPFCKEHGFRYMASSIITSRSNGDSSTAALRLDDEDFLTMFNELEAPKFKSYKPTEFKTNDWPCPSIRNKLNIDCHGDVFPCNSFYCKVGNVNEEELKTIWNDSEVYARLNAIRKKDLQDCVHCEIKEYCTRCPGRALLEDKNLYGCSSLDKRFASALANYCMTSSNDPNRE